METCANTSVLKSILHNSKEAQIPQDRSFIAAVLLECQQEIRVCIPFVISRDHLEELNMIHFDHSDYLPCVLQFHHDPQTESKHQLLFKKKSQLKS